MKKITTLSLVAALAVSSAFAGGDIVPVEEVVVEEAPSEITVSANLAITSNYIWRGMTQTNNSPAVQGGIDLGYKGFYLGTWGSNVEFGDTTNNLEADFYAGYASELMGVGFDLGYIYYAYPNESSAFNFDEAYLGLSYDWTNFGVSGKYSIAVNSKNDTTDYWEVGASAKLPWEVTLAGSYGQYSNVGDNYLVSLAKTFGKFEITVAYTDFSSNHNGLLLSNNEDNIVGTISTSF